MFHSVLSIDRYDLSVLEVMEHMNLFHTHKLSQMEWSNGMYFFTTLWYIVPDESKNLLAHCVKNEHWSVNSIIVIIIMNPLTMAIRGVNERMGGYCSKLNFFL